MVGLPYKACKNIKGIKPLSATNKKAYDFIVSPNKPKFCKVSLACDTPRIKTYMNLICLIW